MSFIRISDKVEMRKILHRCMLNGYGFIPVIFTREHRQAGMFYEGFRPLSSATNDLDTVYTLTSRDVKYSRPVCEPLSLSKIEYIEILK
jgi:hypothetical protein